MNMDIISTTTTNTSSPIVVAKKRILAFTNCQGANVLGAISKLSEIVETYELFTIENYMPMDPEKQEWFDKELLPTIDILLYQHVRDTHPYNTTKDLLAKVSPHTRLVRMPYVYCNWLWLFQHASSMNKTKEIRELLPAPLSREEADQFLRESPLFALKERKEVSMKILHEKEKDCDMKCADFIEENFRTRRLFFSNNHMSTPLIFHLANQFLNVTGITPQRLQEGIHPMGEYNSDQFYPITSYAATQLGLQYYDEDADDFYIQYLTDILDPEKRVWSAEETQKYFFETYGYHRDRTIFTSRFY